MHFVICRFGPFMKVAMMADFMPSLSYLLDSLRKGLGSVARDEPSAPYSAIAQDLKQPNGANVTKLTTRERAWRASVKRAQPYRNRVEIESEAYVYGFHCRRPL